MAHSYRGFTFHVSETTGGGSTTRTVTATRGCISLFAEVEAGELPAQWRLHDVLEYEINRLLDPATLRHVDHLN